MNRHTTTIKDSLLPIVSEMWNNLQMMGFISQDKRLHPKAIEEVNLRTKALAEELRRQFVNITTCM